MISARKQEADKAESRRGVVRFPDIVSPPSVNMESADQADAKHVSYTAWSDRTLADGLTGLGSNPYLRMVSFPDHCLPLTESVLTLAEQARVRLGMQDL